MTERVVMLSGGVASWATARLVRDAHGLDGLTLLFADTKEEDDETYAFLEESAGDIGAPLVRVAEGRTVWQVAFDEGMMPNDRAPICSRILKTEPSRAWVEANCNPSATLYVGLDWTEIHRMPGIASRWAPYRVEAPLMAHRPIMAKADLVEWARREGLTPPSLYAQGFPHANNGGACFRAGQAQWRLLLFARPETYRRWEENEQEFRRVKDGDYSILTDRTDLAPGEPRRPLTLRDFRLRIQSGGQCDLFDFGGCCDAMGAEDEEPRMHQYLGVCWCGGEHTDVDVVLALNRQFAHNIASTARESDG